MGVNLFQKKVINKIAKKYGVNIQDVEEVWELSMQFIDSQINKEIKKKEDLAKLDENSFPIIMLPTLGKFVPYKKMLRFMKTIEIRKDDDKSKPE